MSYIKQFEAQLTKKLEDGTDNTRAIVVWASEKILESYRNGVTAGRKGATVKRDAQSQRTEEGNAE